MQLVARLAMLSLIAGVSTACTGSSPADGSNGGDAADAIGSDSNAPSDTPASDSARIDGTTDTGTTTDAAHDWVSTLACGARPDHSGDGTYYNGDGTGACSFAARPDMMYAAMNAPDFANAGVCGMCVRVSGPMGETTVTITDLCPECLSGALDLSPTAFMMLSPLSAGRIPITWHEVPCDVSGPVVFHVYTGSNPYYLAINVRNHRHRIATLERRGADGTWHPLVRQDYNVWIESPSDAPIATAHLRATDILGSTVEADVPVMEDTDVNASDQFPACTM